MKYIWNNNFVLVSYLSGYWNDTSIWQLNCISSFPKGSRWNILYNRKQEEHSELLNLLWFPFHFLVLLMSKQICNWNDCFTCFFVCFFLSQTKDILDFCEILFLLCAHVASNNEIASATKYVHVCKVQLARRIWLLSFFCNWQEQLGCFIRPKSVQCSSHITFIQ